MFRHAALWLLIALAGCDRLTGAAEQKVSDAEAIGYACRVSLKKPEDCMKENEAQSTASVLEGWKAADKDIANKTLDPSMGQDKLLRAAAAAASAASATEETKPQAKEDAKSAEPAKEKKSTK